ncbi:6244_t:CDS:2, partial [Acaulospora morrowiae]
MPCPAEKKDQIVNNIPSTEDISSENLEQNPQDDSSKQIDLRCDENLTYNIVDNASNSDEPNNASEQVSKEIIQSIREKKIRDQNLSSDNNSSCDIKTVSQGNDQQKTITNTSLPAEDLDDFDEIELTKNQNIELDLIRDLQNSMLIVAPDPIEIPPE